MKQKIPVLDIYEECEAVFSSPDKIKKFVEFNGFMNERDEMVDKTEIARNNLESFILKCRSKSVPTKLENQLEDAENVLLLTDGNLLLYVKTLKELQSKFEPKSTSFRCCTTRN